MKDYLTYQMMASFGVDSPLCSYVYLTVNGEDWGLYLAVEGVEEAFLERNYGSDYGELYKPDSMSMGGGMGSMGGMEVPDDFELPEDKELPEEAEGEPSQNREDSGASEEAPAGESSEAASEETPPEEPSGGAPPQEGTPPDGMPGGGPGGGNFQAFAEKSQKTA